MSEDVVLLPCPFCGGAAQIEPKNWHGRDRIGVFCTECLIFQDSRCPNDDDAIAAWNTRTPDHAARADRAEAAFREAREALHYHAARADRAEEEVERLRGAISWIEPPFVDGKTPKVELRRRIGFCIADAKLAARAALAALEPKP